MFLAGVELATMNTKRFASSAARLGYVYGRKHRKEPLGIYRKEQGSFPDPWFLWALLRAAACIRIRMHDYALGEALRIHLI